MFVRKKKNASGSVSVQIITKENGVYKVIRTIGSSRNPKEINGFCEQAYHIIPSLLSQHTLDFSYLEDRVVVAFLRGINNPDVRTIGPERIFGALFDRLGFNAVKDSLFRHLTIARLVYPTSKLKTVDYLYRYQGTHTSEDAIYRFLDRLNTKYKTQVERIAYEHTRNILKTITVVFYDLTTLYFEAEDEDDLRKIGFSKDGKFQHPQIMLGLLVGERGYPIGYDLFEGNTFEGHTLIPMLEKIQKKYGFKKPVVVADAGLLSKKNLDELMNRKYRFILGGRIKNESDRVKIDILAHASHKENGGQFIIEKQDGTRLIVTYSQRRARKDAHNRERGLKKLRAQIRSGKLNKAQINNRGYNKFLVLTGNVDVVISQEKIKEDEQWDGLKGYITNTRFSPRRVVEQYGNLWQIEKAFRISKTDLRIRPIYHYRKRRIEAHICIAFVAYTIYKELERLLYKHNAGFSPQRAIELTQNMYEIHFRLPRSQRQSSLLLGMSQEQKRLWDIVQKG